MTKNSSINIDGKTINLPVLEGTIGPDVIDISKLYAETGKFTLDPGFTSTASCQSSITYIDGDKGECYYRGYPMDVLAEKSSFLEIVHLLWTGSLPTKSEWYEYSEAIKTHTMVHEQMKTFFNGFRRGSHPMAILTSVVAALSAFYRQALARHRTHQPPSGEGLPLRPRHQQADVVGQTLRARGRTSEPKARNGQQLLQQRIAQSDR